MFQSFKEPTKSAQTLAFESENQLLIDELNKMRLLAEGGKIDANAYNEKAFEYNAKLIAAGGQDGFCFAPLKV